MTLKDIARDVGISYQAVSAVLNNRPGIRVSAKRREQILEIARKGGYQRNFSYDLFRRRKTNTMAIIPSIQFQKEIALYRYADRVVIRHWSLSALPYSLGQSSL